MNNKNTTNITKFNKNFSFYSSKASMNGIFGHSSMVTTSTNGIFGHNSVITTSTNGIFRHISVITTSTNGIFGHSLVVMTSVWLVLVGQAFWSILFVMVTNVVDPQNLDPSVLLCWSPKLLKQNCVNSEI